MPNSGEYRAGRCQQRARAAGRRRRALGERAQLPIKPLQFGIAFCEKRREPVAFADQLLVSARALFEAWLELLATLAGLGDLLRQAIEPVRERRNGTAMRRR